MGYEVIIMWMEVLKSRKTTIEDIKRYIDIYEHKEWRSMNPWERGTLNFLKEVEHFYEFYESLFDEVEIEYMSKSLPADRGGHLCDLTLLKRYDWGMLRIEPIVESQAYTAKNVNHHMDIFLNITGIGELGKAKLERVRHIEQSVEYLLENLEGLEEVVGNARVASVPEIPEGFSVSRIYRPFWVMFFKKILMDIDAKLDFYHEGE